MSKTLLAGPWTGEFGWHVAVWAPIIRNLAKIHKKTIVICPKGTEALYQDFTSKFIFLESRELKDRWKAGGKDPKVPSKIKRMYPLANIISPNKTTIYNCKREYFKYGSLRENLQYDLVIHARAESKFGQTNRNWPLEKYQELLKELGDIRACSIGTCAYHIKGTEDRRKATLDVVMNILASSKLCIGPSSGPMHLASLCGCPHVVFSDDKYQKSIKATNHDRYRKLWNPFNTKCKVLDSNDWDPPVNKVVRAVRKYWE